MRLIASFRMYDVTPAVAAAWRALFARVFDDVGARIDVVEHRWPQPIASLWREPGLACAFMCGWPFVRSGSMRALAAPVPSPPRYGGLPRYRSEFLAREASGIETLEDAFGRRFGWMSDDSQSGFNAPRAALSSFVNEARRSLFAEVRGPLGSPATALDTLQRGEVDVVALDSFWLDLCRHHEPGRLSGIRSVASTPWTPIPPLVAGPDVDATLLDRLVERLVLVHEDPRSAADLAAVLVSRFVVPDVAAYGMLEAMAREAAARGYATIR